jgi:hypothetical protein
MKEEYRIKKTERGYDLGLKDVSLNNKMIISKNIIIILRGKIKMNDIDKYTFLYIPQIATNWEEIFRKEIDFSFETNKTYCFGNEYDFLLIRALLKLHKIDNEMIQFRNCFDKNKKYYKLDKQFRNNDFFNLCKFGLIDEALDVLLDLGK